MIRAMCPLVWREVLSMNRRLGISLLAVCAALVFGNPPSTIPFTDRIDFGTLQDNFNQERGHRT